MISTAGAHEVLCIACLVIARRKRIRHENRGLAGRSELPDGGTGARQYEVACRDRRAEPIRLGDHAVVVTTNAAAHDLVVTPAGHVQDRRARRAPGLDHELVQRLGAGECAEHTQDVFRAGQLEDRATFLPGTASERAGIGRPTTRVLDRRRTGTG